MTNDTVLDKQNPSNSPDALEGGRKRIPLSVPMRKLEAPEMPGFYLRWFKGTPQRIAQAERAGFVFVTEDEVRLNNVSVGGDADRSGNTDMGSRVSVVEGGEVDGQGQAVRLYLMKQPLEYKKEDDQLIQQRNDSVADALTASFRAGTVGGRDQGEQPEDLGARYVDPRRSRIPDLFRRKGTR